MNILIVEDSEIKARRLTDCVKEASEQNVCVLRATAASDAFKVVMAESIDLMLLDVRLPLQNGHEPSDAGSVWLLREMCRKVPRGKTPLVVGTTQYEDSIGNVAGVFSEYLWCIAYVSEESGMWRQQIARAVSLTVAKALTTPLGGGAYSTDCAIVVALRSPEFDQVFDLVREKERFVVEETNEHWVKAKIDARDGRRLDLLVACADEMGMCSMSALVTRACVAARPNWLILAGIMGGNASRVAIGDLILVDETWDFRAGKITETGFQPDVRSQRGSQTLLNIARGVLTDALLQQFWSDWTREKPRAFPRLHVGPVACSPAVISDAKVFDQIEDQKRKVLGVEMEAYGCYDASRRLGSLAPEALCIKAVCDLGDSKKADQYQDYCAYISARAALTIFNNC